MRLKLNTSALVSSDPHNPGFIALKQATMRGPLPIKLVVGGGDGTVMFADSECEKHGIDTSSQVVLGIVPLGTGNDFARSYGWGGRNPSNILKNDCETLRKLAKKWAAATLCQHDVWQVTLKVSEVKDIAGSILKVNSEKEEEAI